MKVEIFCLCDFAQSTEQGKLNIIGVFDSIIAPQLPAVHGLFAIAAKLTLNNGETGRKKMKISFLDSDQKPIATPIESELVIPAQNAPNVTVQISTLVPQIQLAQYGHYSVVLDFDGQQVASTLLHCRRGTNFAPMDFSPPQS